MTFQELEKWPVLAQCCEMFQGLTGLPFHLVDRDYRGSARFSQQPERDSFCDLIQSLPEGRRRCQSSACENGSGQPSRIHPCVYRCHAGLVDIAVPIASRGETIGYLCSGKVRDGRTSARDLSRLMCAWRAAGYDDERLKASYRRTRIVPAGSLAAIARLLQFIVSYLLEMEDKLALLARHRAARDPVLKAQEYVREHYAEPLHLETVARHAGLSPSRFNHVFRHSVGISFARYLREVRLDKVKWLLESSCLRVTEIALLCGFASLGNFNRLFKAREGLTPRAFRHRYGRCPEPDGA